MNLKQLKKKEKYFRDKKIADLTDDEIMEFVQIRRSVKEAWDKVKEILSAIDE